MIPQDTPEIAELRMKAIALRAKGQEHESIAKALTYFAQATRIQAWIEVLEGKREMLRHCIEISKTGATPKTDPPRPQPSHRRYQLKDTGGLKANCDFLTRQAHQRIAQRQLEKPYRKPMPPPVFKLT